MRPYNPVFPDGGWTCIRCHRNYGFCFAQCAYCRKERMHLLIDKENMLLLRKSQDYGNISKLCDMEFPHVATSLIYCDHPEAFRSFTDLELKLLIKNANGPDVISVFSHDALCKIIHSMVLQMPEVEVNAYELELQWRTVQPRDKKPYKYVPGGFAPVCAEGLAETTGWTYKARHAGSGLPAPASPAKAVSQGVAAPRASSAAPRPAQAAGDESFTMPKPGTSTHTIFMFCAERWKEAGYVDDNATLNKVKKDAVDSLVPQGLNISTVRTQAARWYQHRTKVVI